MTSRSLVPTRDSPRDKGALPGQRELNVVCGVLDLDPSGARMLPSRSNAVFHLPTVDVVVRLSNATPTNEARAALVVSLTRWIADHAGPALAPTSCPQPVRVASAVATLWPYLSSPRAPLARDLATAVQELHHLNAPAPPLPEHQPLARLREALDLDTARDLPVLSTETRTWLLARAAQLQRAYDTTMTPLGGVLSTPTPNPTTCSKTMTDGGCSSTGIAPAMVPGNSTSPSPSPTTFTSRTATGPSSAPPTATTSPPGPAGP